MAEHVDARARVEANEALLVKQDGAFKLLNALTDERTQWVRAFGRKDYVDVFGDLIPEGRTHYRQGEALNDNCLRVSAKSMNGVLIVLFSNRYAIKLATEGAATRFEQLRTALLSVAGDGATPRPEGL